MIWGIQWDETLKWLIDTGEKTYSEVGKDSISWGNYCNNSFTYYTNTSKSVATKASNSYTKIPSGAYEGANANNIFDLAGNVCDCTLESDISKTGNYRYIRGGNYSSYGFSGPAAVRDYNEAIYDVGPYIGLRASLFIK